MTTNIDWGRKLFGKPKADKAARLRHGVTASASSDGYVSVLLDGSDEPVTLACSGSFDVGQSVYVVNDGGSYAIMGDGGTNAPDGGGASSGLFALEVDEEGNLYAVYEDGATPPSFELDESGDLYYIIEE